MDSGYGNLPFDIGSTYFGPQKTPVLTEGEHIVGRIFNVHDEDRTARIPGATPRRSNRMRQVMAVRNKSAFNLLPKRLVLPVLDGVGGYMGQVAGYASNLAEFGLPVDEFLPAAGVRPNDIFFVVVGGPCKVLLPEAGVGFNGDIAIGDALFAATGSTSGNTLGVAGRIGKITATSTADAPAVAVERARSYLGTALSAATTGQTNTDMLVNIEQFRIRT